MDVVIKGITLPKNCNECNFLWFAKYKIPMCLLGEMIDDTDSKPEWCPLSNDTQKKPHGYWTLIDKGHYFYDWKCSVCGGSGRGDYLFCPNCGTKMEGHFEEPEINPCRGCEDYDGKGGCISNGGCGVKMDLGGDVE